MNVPIYWFRPKKWFDVRIKELVSKVQNSGPFLIKNVFRVHVWRFCEFRLVAWPCLHQSL